MKEWERWTSLLSADEMSQVERYRHAEARDQHAVGRSIARKMLAVEKAIDPRTIELEALPHGKPIVRSPSIARRPFNIAHTRGLVICGMACGDTSPNAHMGVDVESLARETTPDLAERYFAQPEVDYLRRQPNQIAIRETFLRIWTLKESFIKAIGTGLSTPLADFAFEDIHSDQPRIQMLSDELKSDKQWRFEVFHPRPGFIASVAVCEGQLTDCPELDLKCVDLEQVA